MYEGVNCTLASLALGGSFKFKSQNVSTLLFSCFRDVLMGSHFRLDRVLTKMNGVLQQSSLTDVNWAGRKYNIAPEFSSSPYLKPIGFVKPEKRAQKLKELSQLSKKSTRRRQTENDVESVVSFRTQRSLVSQRSLQSHRSNRSSVAKHMILKNILLPREIDKLCHEFRQKHNIQRPNLKTKIGVQLDDDTSTICSEFADSLEDKAVYSRCHKDYDVENALFPGGFGEMSYRNATREKAEGPIVRLPPIRLVQHEKASGDVSDLDSLHSGHGQARRR